MHEIALFLRVDYFVHYFDSTAPFVRQDPGSRPIIVRIYCVFGAPGPKHSFSVIDLGVSPQIDVGRGPYLRRMIGNISGYMINV